MNDQFNTMKEQGASVKIILLNDVFLKNIFGEQKVFNGKIKELKLVDHKIVLEK